MKAGSTIPETTLYADEAPAGLLVPPTSAQFHAGTEPEMTLPAAWWNYFVQLFTDTNIKAKADINNIFAELTAVLTAAGITPSDVTTSQVLTALNVFLALKVDKTTFNIDAAHNEFEYSNTRAYSQGDVVYTITSNTLKSMYIRTSPSPTTITGISPTDRAHWAIVNVMGSQPLSDLSRVMRINGDGVPTFPDNVAGTVYKSNFSTTDGWVVSGGTISVLNGELVATATATTMYVSRALSSGTGRQIRITLTSPTWGLIFVGRVDGVDNAIIPQRGYEQNKKVNIDAYVAGTLEFITTGYVDIAIGNKVVISEAYIGSGLYDTPVYDKACCNRATNYGVLPVPAPRGLGLQFFGNGSKPLVFDNPVIGVTGTIRFKFKTPATFTDGCMLGNATASTGIQIFTSTAGASWLNVRTAGGSIVAYAIGLLVPSAEYTFSFYFTLTTLYVYRNGVLVYTYTLTASVINSTANLYVGRDAQSAAGQDFTLYSFEYVAEAETLDAHIRFMNGDDAVDSQQKSVTGTPHAIAVYGADGGLKAHGGATVWDSSNVATGWTTALAAAVEAGGRALLGLVSLGTNWIANLTASAPWDLIIDSNAKLTTWATSGTYEKVLIKKGTWTLASGGVNLTARGTKLVIGEPGSKLVFSSATSGLSYTSVPTTKDYRMDGVTVEGSGTLYGYGFNSCTNLVNCTGTGTGTGDGTGTGFNSCTNLVNCTGTGTGTLYGAGFNGCTNLVNCTGTGTDTGPGTGYGFNNCKKCQQCTATGSTAKYSSSYADSATSYACADTPNGGFNS